MSGLTLCAFSEEILHEVVFLLVDDTDYENRSYPECTYICASTDIVSVSLVNHQFRRICLPFLFSCIICTSLEDFEIVEEKCLSKPAFARLVRTLDLDLKLPRDENDCLSPRILRLLPYLDGLQWVDLRSISIDKALLEAINEHNTLTTAVTRNLKSLPPQLPLHKIMLELLFSVTGARPAIERGMRVGNLDLDMETIQIPSLVYSSIIPGLHEMSLIDSSQETVDLEQFNAFLVKHPALRSIDFYMDPLWEPSNITKRHLSSFVKAVEEESLTTEMQIQYVTISSSGSNERFDSWVVTGIDLSDMKSSESLVNALRLVGKIYPKLLALGIEFNPALTIHIDALITFISEYLPDLRVLRFGEIMPSLICTPSRVPMYAEANSKHEATKAHSEWIAWQFFQAVPSLFCISSYEKFDHDESQHWELDTTSYRPKRDFSGAVVKMEMRGNLEVLFGQPASTFFRESITREYKL
ncbi:hypothetical protein C8J56DRAFT_963664, partial [Mycena floridula]